MKKMVLTLLFFLIFNLIFADSIPLRELRGIWISTVKMLDYPSKRGLNAEQLKDEFIQILDTCVSAGINAIFFQIRPAADAFFVSDYEPWSEWLTGKQGRPPSPFFDPLEFMIKETHKRHIRFYAWINPFRAIATIEYADISKNHITRKKPYWFFNYGKHKYFNPGIPEVRDYLTAVIRDIVKRYDVDAIVFDDYFYPYPERDDKNKIIPIPDYSTYKKYGKGFSNIKDWRRNNINLFIEQVSKAIKEEKPWVIFGISPPAVWRNRRYDPEGSNTRGLAAYDWLYADVLKWLENGWIDFVSPQLYFYIGHKYADYETLINWWTEHNFGRNLYISLNINALSNPKGKWKNPSEIPEQIKMARKFQQVKGFILYRYTDFAKNSMGIRDTLKKNYFKDFVFYPQLPYIDSIPPEPPSYVKKYRIGNNITVYWEIQDKQGLSPMDTVDFYVVYKFEGKKTGEIGKRENIFLITRDNEFTLTRKHKLQLFGKKYTFVITAFDRFHNESKPSTPIKINFSKNE